MFRLRFQNKPTGFSASTCPFIITRNLSVLNTSNLTCNNNKIYISTRPPDILLLHVGVSEWVSEWVSVRRPCFRGVPEGSAGPSGDRSLETRWRGSEVKQDLTPDHGGACRAGHLTWALGVRGVRGRPGLLHQVSGGSATLYRTVWRELFPSRPCNRCFSPPSLPLSLAPSLPGGSDETRATTWLHPRSAEPVNSGHMIRSGSSLRGGCLTSCLL